MRKKKKRFVVQAIAFLIKSNKKKNKSMLKYVEFLEKETKKKPMIYLYCSDKMKQKKQWMLNLNF